MKELAERIERNISDMEMQIAALDLVRMPHACIDRVLELLLDLKAALSQKQEVVGKVVEANDGTLTAIVSSKAGALKVGDDVYTAPPSTAQGVEDALERELNMIHMTLASFQSPAKAIQELLNWYISVEKDPKVNGGMVMVPVKEVAHLRSCAELRVLSERGVQAMAERWLKAASKGGL